MRSAKYLRDGVSAAGSAYFKGVLIALRPAPDYILQLRTRRGACLQSSGCINGGGANEFNVRSGIMVIEVAIFVLYSARDDQVIFVSFFFRPATLQMLAVALATPALCASQDKKIN